MSDDVENAGRVALRTGRVIGAVFCLIFLSAGLAFGWWIARETWKNGQAHFWKPTACLILRADAISHGTHPGGPYSLAIRYEYRWHQRSLTSENVYSRPKQFNDYQEVQRLLEKYRPGTSANCLVNPQRPEEAVLEKQALWAGALILIPLVFVVVGLAGFYGAVFGRNPPPRGMDVTGTEPAALSSSGTQPRRAAGWLILFFLLFLAIGFAAVYITFIRPLLRMETARNWNRVSCEVISSQVSSHRGNEGGTTYSVEILYEYRVDGRTYRSNRYSFVTASGSGRSAKQKIVGQHPAGLQTVCYVNPKDPADAVLEPGAVQGLWLGLIPLVFVLAGVGGMILVMRQRATKRPGALVALGRGSTGPAGRGMTPDAGEMVLRAAGGRAARFIAMLVFALFWNGIVSVFVYQLVKSAQRGSVEWVLAIFLIPFVLIGLFVLVLAGYFFLGLFAPRAVLTLGSSAIPLGGSTRLTWQFEGRAHSIEQLRILVTGREEATSRRNNKPVTERSVFAEIEVASVTGRNEIRSGQAVVTIPADAMHSFAAHGKRVLWTLQMKGVIRRFPDLDDEFALTVLPAPIRKDAA